MCDQISCCAAHTRSVVSAHSQHYTTFARLSSASSSCPELRVCSAALCCMIGCISSTWTSSMPFTLLYSTAKNSNVHELCSQSRPCKNSVVRGTWYIHVDQCLCVHLRGSVSMSYASLSTWFTEGSSPFTDTIRRQPLTKPTQLDIIMPHRSITKNTNGKNYRTTGRCAHSRGDKRHTMHIHMGARTQWGHAHARANEMQQHERRYGTPMTHTTGVRDWNEQ